MAKSLDASAVEAAAQKIVEGHGLEHPETIRILIPDEAHALMFRSVKTQDGVEYKYRRMLAGPRDAPNVRFLLMDLCDESV